MQFNPLTIMATLLASLVLAAKPGSKSPVPEFKHPVPNRPDPKPFEMKPFNITNHPGLNKRGQVAGVYICQGQNWGGPCQWQVASDGACHSTDSNVIMKSFGPDHGIYCQVFGGTNCNPEVSGASRRVTYPGWNQWL